jgi:hypothetical protein
MEQQQYEKTLEDTVIDGVFVKWEPLSVKEAIELTRSSHPELNEKVSDADIEEWWTQWEEDVDLLADREKWVSDVDEYNTAIADVINVLKKFKGKEFKPVVSAVRKLKKSRPRMPD